MASSEPALPNTSNWLDAHCTLLYRYTQIHHCSRKNTQASPQ